MDQTALQKDKRRAMRRKRNLIAKEMRMNKIFHEKTIKPKQKEEKEIKVYEECPWCGSYNECLADDVDKCYYS